MELYPAIDLLGGRCVRLVEGDFQRATVYEEDPLRVAEAFAADGTRWLHVVDLDAARAGRPVNREIVARIAGLTGDTRVQSGGGVRTVDDVAALIDGGVARVVVGTAAVDDPGLVERAAMRWPGQVAVALDHRGGEVRTRGWTHGAELGLAELAGRAEQLGAAAVVATDVSRDGRLTGTDQAGLRSLLDRTTLPVIASGGLSSLDELAALVSLRSSTGRSLAGVVVGKALYEGRFSVRDALRALERSK